MCVHVIISVYVYVSLYIPQTVVARMVFLTTHVATTDAKTYKQHWGEPLNL